MATLYNSSKGKACWKASGKIVMTINEIQKKRQAFCSLFWGEDAAAANWQLGGRDKPKGKAEDLERKGEH